MEDPRCCGTGTCIINAEGYCWCGQRWDGTRMCFPEAADRTTEVFPDLARRLQNPLARLTEDLLSLRTLRPVPCHRDLHEGQILMHQGSVGLLDFDTLRLGEGISPTAASTRASRDSDS